MGLQRLSAVLFFHRKMESSKGVLIGIMITLLFTGCRKTVKEEVEVGFKGLAKVDHFLAGSRMLGQMGVEAHSYATLPEFPPPPNTMLFLPMSSIESEGMLEELDDWLYDEGGALVCYLQRGGDVDLINDEVVSAFLTYFGAEYDFVKEYDYDPVPEDEEERKKYFKEQLSKELNGGEEEEEIKETELLAFPEMEGFKAEYEVSVDPDYHLGFQSDEKVDKVHLSYDYGEGHIYFWSTAAAFTNPHLMDAQHATLLWDLVKSKDPERVWFVHSSQLSFWKLLWEKGAPALVTFALLVVLWLWFFGKRFGPIFQSVNATKNNLSEHLTATGHFFSLHRADSLVIEQVKETIYLKLARKCNLPINAEKEELLSACETQNILSDEHLSLLVKELPEKKKEQLSYIKELQHLLSSL